MKKEELLAICAEEVIANEPLRDFLYQHPSLSSRLYDFLEDGIIAINSFPNKNINSLYELEKHLVPHAELPDKIQSRWDMLIECVKGLRDIWNECQRLSKQKTSFGVNIEHLADSYCANLLNIVHKNESPTKPNRYRTSQTPLASKKLAQVSSSIVKIASNFSIGRPRTLKSIRSKRGKNKKAFVVELQKEFSERIAESLEIISQGKFDPPHVINDQTAPWHENLIGTLQDEIQSHCDFAFSLLDKILHYQVIEFLEQKFSLFRQGVRSFQNQNLPFVTADFKKLVAAGAFELASVAYIKDFKRSLFPTAVPSPSGTAPGGVIPLKTATKT